DRQRRCTGARQRAPQRPGVRASFLAVGGALGHMWSVDPDALESIAIGAGILGTGGGGNPYLGKLAARRLLREGSRVDVVSLDELPDDARLVTVGGMGAPTITIEKISRGTETLCAMRTLEDY